MVAFLITLMVNTYWNTGCVALLATNNHVKFGLINVSFAMLSLVIAIILARYTNSLPCIVYSTLLMELVLAYYVTRRFKRMIACFPSYIN